MDQLLKIKKTLDGSITLYRPDIDEHYHSHFGALQESKHIYLKGGFDFVKKKDISIFELGFGTGLNAFLTWWESSKKQKNIHYTTIEKFPISVNLSKEINYSGDWSEFHFKNIFNLMHQCPWEKEIQIDTNFKLHKIAMDYNLWQPTTNFDLVYFDAFAPDKEPELWDLKNFEKLCNFINPSGVLVTYTVKGSVKRNLQSLGMRVEKHPGPPGKREFLRAIKI